MMQAVFKTELDNIERENIRIFCESVNYCSLEQLLGFPEILLNNKINYFYLTDNGVIKSFCQILEKFRFAHIWYGPVCSDKDLMIYSINEIVNFYRKRLFFYLGIQIYIKAGYDTEYIEYYLNKTHNIKYLFNNENTKSSLEINLEENLEDIYRNIRKGHKSDIKKALKAGLSVVQIEDASGIKSFIDIYLKMCKTRGIRGHSEKEITGICNYLISNRKGQILVAKDGNDLILGGAIFAFQGISVRYLIGASDPERRDIPLLHPVIFDAIEWAKRNNFKYFDFWGYNHFANDDDQANNINHFKKGFGGYYTFMAKKMNISLLAGGYKIYSTSTYIKSLIRRQFLKFKVQ